MRQLFGRERFEHPELVALMNDLPAQEWSRFTNHFRPTFKLRQRERQNGQTQRVHEATSQTPYQRLLESPDIPEATKEKLRAQHASLDPFTLKKNIEFKLRKFFAVLGNLNREAAKPQRLPPKVTFSRESTRPPPPASPLRLQAPHCRQPSAPVADAAG